MRSCEDRPAGGEEVPDWNSVLRPGVATVRRPTILIAHAAIQRE